MTKKMVDNVMKRKAYRVTVSENKTKNVVVDEVRLSSYDMLKRVTPTFQAKAKYSVTKLQVSCQHSSV